MEFGRVPEASLNKIDFVLPPDPAFNKKVLKGKPSKNSKVWVGCAKWGRKEWIGKIYPLKTKEKDFLDNYVHHYNSIELNATHYQVYKEDTIKKWSDKAGNKDFLFCPKMYKGVTHFGSLKGKEFITTEFLKGVIAFGKHLGPIFVQVSESFAPKRKIELFEYLETLPKDLQFFLEVRHPEWFEKEIMEELVIKLKELNMGIVITDTSGRRDCAHMYLTMPKTFIRFVGNSLHQTDFPRVDDWAKRIKYWLASGIQEVYFFMHMHDEATSPELTIYLVDQFNAACGLKLEKPKFVPGHETLFG